MEMEYTLSGTVEGINNMLVRDFGLSEDEAKFSTYVMVSQIQEKKKIDSDELEMWYLKNDANYTTALFNSHYTISITDLKIQLLKKLFVLATVFLATKDMGLPALVAETILIFGDCIKHIENEEYCVFSLAVKTSKIKPEFDLEDILPNKIDKECTYKSDKWQCPFLRGDNCIITKENVQRIVNRLCTKSALEEVNELYKIKF